MFKVKLTKNADKELVKVSKTNIKLAKKIDFFLYGVLEKVEQPKLLLNAKKLQNYGNDYYR